jgi:hypothetical protein
MSVSSHLTPEPERRLWLILEAVTSELKWAEAKLAALAVLAAAELFGAAALGARGPAAAVASGALLLALVAGMLALLPLSRPAPWLSFLDDRGAKPASADCLIASDDLAKYSRSELILKLDRYLGGGVTTTQYYEDAVGQILSQARGASRKKRLLRGLVLVVAAAQICVASALVAGPR